MQKVLVYSTRLCPYCHMARQLLKSKGVEFEEIRVDGDGQKRAQMTELTGRHTVPQIFVGETHVGGFDDLSSLERAGRLDPLLAGN